MTAGNFSLFSFAKKMKKSLGILSCMLLLIAMSCSEKAATDSESVYKNKVALVRKAYDSNSWENYKSYFADTVSFRFSDGTVWNISSDTLLSRLKYYRGLLASNDNVAHNEIVTADSATGDNWVRSWGIEKWSDTNGKADSILLQENWRFNSDGRIVELQVYTSKAMQ
ncbi:hypothetical protein OI18_02185 [Flavihumibacter solisilvae]|uniref:SnoaL-like domain-containing protein n=2 Tax=Flavihumibacter solisilvae TaxID=1349421 RepID=A0A0C1LL12_9BACT|nr:hypothetical protein OI18_02185 [Flavihumibacter solisilvae]